MALTEFQRGVCRLLADQRVASGESYVAGASALNELLQAPRLSRDIDLFHDTDEALRVSWQVDRELLERHGFVVRVVRERPAFVEAEVARGPDAVRVEWMRDSAFRFFPLVRHPDLGLTLHPFDLATGKVLALVGRLEVRDWIDVMQASERIQPLGYLAWAACGKDPGFTPPGVLEHAARSTHYTDADVRALSFAGPPPDAADLSRRWHAMLAGARAVVALLPAAGAGQCVLGPDGRLYVGEGSALRRALARGEIRFHPGRIGGAFPEVKPLP